jgi:hypothetical protein
MTAPSRLQAGRAAPGLLVLDEFPYLAQETPGLPSIVQSLYDRLGPGAVAGTTSLRLILCGSAISVMSDLLSGTRALRGRAALELRVRPFGHLAHAPVGHAGRCRVHRPPARPAA